jgi:hypothetical protein
MSELAIYRQSHLHIGVQLGASKSGRLEESDRVFWSSEHAYKQTEN